MRPEAWWRFTNSTGWAEFSCWRSANSFFDFVQRKSALERILSQDEALLAKLRVDQAAQQALLEQLNAGQAEKQASELALNQRIAALAAEQERRGQLLKNPLGKGAGARLRCWRSARPPRSWMKPSPRWPCPRRRSEPARPAAPKADDQPQPVASTASNRFESHKGLLDWPVRGKIISTFGPYTERKIQSGPLSKRHQHPGRTR